MKARFLGDVNINNKITRAGKKFDSEDKPKSILKKKKDDIVYKT